jgi:hypothetical protein
MEAKLIIFLYLLAYSFLVSQSFSYIISLTNVQKNLSVLSYIEFRKLTDKNFRAKFKWVFYTTLVIGPVAIWLTTKEPTGLLFITVLLSYILFWIDAIIMLKGNMPINNAINTWTAEKYPADWSAQRDKWLYFFRLRQVMNIIGFIGLMVGVVFR